MDPKYVKILGVRVDSTSKERVLTSVGKKLENKTKFSLFTPNPEIVLAAYGDSKLAGIINNCDFSIADGVGLKLAAPSLEIIHGRKLMLDLFGLANKKGLNVFFITSNLLNTKDKLLAKLKRQYPNIRAQAMVGPKVDLEAEPVSQVDRKINSDIVSEINMFKPDLLFVCFGASKQEKWIARHLPKLNVTGAIGIGGSLDYYAETKPTPPRLMEKLELEWLWRLFFDPTTNISRVINAAVIFPFKVLIFGLRS